MLNMHIAREYFAYCPINGKSFGWHTNKYLRRISNSVGIIREYLSAHRTRDSKDNGWGDLEHPICCASVFKTLPASLPTEHTCHIPRTPAVI